MEEANAWFAKTKKRRDGQRLENCESQIVALWMKLDLVNNHDCCMEMHQIVPKQIALYILKMNKIWLSIN